MKKRYALYILAILIYLIVNLLTISKFPFVHSDETWLAGLSLTIKKAGTFQVTEPFFAVYPRQAHAIKSIFHWVQGTWMSVFGYGVVQVRLLSFIVSSLSLVMYFKFLSIKLNRAQNQIINKPSPLKSSQSMGASVHTSVLSSWLPFLCTGLMALSIQFIYTSHLGRQEAFILFFMALAYFLVDIHIVHQHYPKALIYTCVTGVITGLAIGFHPNSFLIACVVGSMLIYDALLNQRILPTLLYTTLTGLIASIYVFISISWNRSFIADYGSYGQSQGISGSVMGKISAFPTFIHKLFNQISGTYYTPNIRLELILLGVLSVLSLVLLTYRWFVKRYHTQELALPLLGILGLSLGLVIIGRYNATSIVFYIPFIGLMAFGLMQTLNSMGAKTYKFQILLVILLISLSIKSGITICQYELEDYNDYTSELTKALSKDIKEDQTKSKSPSKVLVNLNAGFAFNPNTFLDYRDLGALTASETSLNTSLETYLTDNSINYIVLSEEMDYIYRNPDPWDILYGPMDYYPHLLNIIEKEYDIIHTFESPQYGMRIVRYNDGYPWTIRVFKKRR